MLATEKAFAKDAVEKIEGVFKVASLTALHEGGREISDREDELGIVEAHGRWIEG